MHLRQNPTLSAIPRISLIFLASAESVVKGIHKAYESAVRRNSHSIGRARLTVYGGSWSMDFDGDDPWLQHGFH
jgi:hypothetical protein